MLQSAIFADLQAQEIDTVWSALTRARRNLAQKSSFARLKAWHRDLQLHNDLQRLDTHLLRDIGVLDRNDD